MADAYDVMSMAKRSGAQLQLEEDWDKYLQDIEAYQRSQSKGGFLKGLAQMGIAKAIPSIMSKILPGAGILDKCLRAYPGGTLTDALTQAIKGGKGGVPEFASSLKGPYGQAALRKLKKGGKKIKTGIEQAQEDERETDKLLAYMGAFAADKEGWKNIFEKVGEGIKTSGQDFRDAWSNRDVAQGNKEFLDFIGTTTGEIGDANDLENALNSIWERGLGEDPDVGISSLGGGFGAPSDTISKIQPTAMNISTPPQGLGLAPLSASEATSLPYKIPLGDHLAGTTNLPYSASSFAMPSKGGTLDTLGVLQNTSRQYKPESIIERLFPQMGATQNPMMKNLLQSILSGRGR